MYKNIIETYSSHMKNYAMKTKKLNFRNVINI